LGFSIENLLLVKKKLIKNATFVARYKLGFLVDELSIYDSCFLFLGFGLDIKGLG
jgi:hypothetical protein